MTADLVVVEVETRSGQRYLVPAVPRSMLANIIKVGAMENVQNMILVNADAACVSIPKHTIARVVSEGEVFWCNSPA